MDKKFDVVVIGGGAGGLFAASVANALGAKTCLIDKKRLGGDCTWFGCMPSKAILKSAQVANYFKDMNRFGLDLDGQLKINTDNVMTHVRSIVDEIATHHPNEVFEKRGIEIIIGPPKFLDSGSIEINGKKIVSKKFILCTGSHPMVPPIDGLGDIQYLTNENVFDLGVLPKELIVLGGGPIGVELAQALSRLGVKIQLVEMMDRILFREDEDVAKVLERKIAKEGVLARPFFRPALFQVQEFWL